ncbi:MAG: VOC family protein [Ignavibacteriales bacterium]|nr:VOC family protein [Ignavibacteriales bacterium]
MISRIDHTTMTVRSLERSVNFYTNLIGFVVDHDMWIPEANLKIVFLRIGDTMLELFGVPKVDGVAISEKNEVVGYKHICLLTDGVDREYERLSQAGVKFHVPPKNVQNVRVAFFKDPDGMDIELIEYQKKEAIA